MKMYIDDILIRYILYKDLIKVKEHYLALSDHSLDEEILYIAISHSTIEIVDFFLEYISGDKDKIEKSAIISCQISKIKYLISKGYTFSNREAMVIASSQLYLPRMTDNAEVAIYDLITRRVYLREVYESNEGYLSWLSEDLYDALLL